METGFKGSRQQPLGISFFLLALPEGRRLTPPVSLLARYRSLILSPQCSRRFRGGFCELGILTSSCKRDTVPSIMTMVLVAAELFILFYFY